MDRQNAITLRLTDGTLKSRRMDWYGYADGISAAMTEGFNINTISAYCGSYRPHRGRSWAARSARASQAYGASCVRQARALGSLS